MRSSGKMVLYLAAGILVVAVALFTAATSAKPECDPVVEYFCAEDDEAPGEFVEMEFRLRADCSGKTSPTGRNCDVQIGDCVCECERSITITTPSTGAERTRTEACFVSSFPPRKVGK